VFFPSNKDILHYFTPASLPEGEPTLLATSAESSEPPNRLRGRASQPHIPQHTRRGSTTFTTGTCTWNIPRRSSLTRLSHLLVDLPNLSPEPVFRIPRDTLFWPKSTRSSPRSPSKEGLASNTSPDVVDALEFLHRAWGLSLSHPNLGEGNPEVLPIAAFLSIKGNNSTITCWAARHHMASFAKCEVGCRWVYWCGLGICTGSLRLLEEVFW